MSARVVGAILAFAAAMALTLSSFSGAWWNGHPSVNGAPITRKDVQIGLGGGHGCNNGGETRECTELPLTGGVPALMIVEFITSNLAALVMLAVGVTILQREPRRKILGKVALAASAASILVALLLLVLGPGVKAEHVSVPIGYGMLVFWIGAMSAVASCLIAQRELPAPSTAQMRLPPVHVLAPPTAPVPQQPFDVLALLRDEPAREPVVAVERPPPSPGGNLPGYSGPLGAPSVDGAPSPLFASAPQLRPLYEMNGGAAPTTSPPPAFPNRPPTPIPRANISAAAGIPTPPPFGAVSPPRLPARTKPPATRPPVREEVPSPTSRTNPPINRAQPTIASMAVPPPPAIPAPPVLPATPPIRPETDAADRAETEAREDVTHERELQTVDRGGEFSEGEIGDSTSPSVAPAEESVADEQPTERESSDDIETIAIDKVRPSDLGLGTADTAPAEAAPSDPARPDTSTNTEVKVAISTAPESLPPPDEHSAPASGPSPACPQCEAPMRWVEEHLRFYCKSCRMYF